MFRTHIEELKLFKVSPSLPFSNCWIRAAFAFITTAPAPQVVVTALPQHEKLFDYSMSFSFV
jgi:hypothetical protein